MNDHQTQIALNLALEYYKVSGQLDSDEEVIATAKLFLAFLNSTTT